MNESSGCISIEGIFNQFRERHTNPHIERRWKPSQTTVRSINYTLSFRILFECKLMRRTFSTLEINWHVLISGLWNCCLNFLLNISDVIVDVTKDFCKSRNRFKQKIFFYQSNPLRQHWKLLFQRKNFCLISIRWLVKKLTF